MALMGFRHVGGLGGVPAPQMAADMGGHALAAMEQLDRGEGQAGVDVLVAEGVGDRVVMPVQLDVVVDVDAGVVVPLADDEALGGQRPEGGLVQAHEEVVAAGAVQAHGAGVQVLEELGDARVEGAEGEEALVAEAGEDPPRDDLHRGLDLRLIPWFSRPGRQDDRAVVLRELLVRLLQPRLVPARDDDAALQLVGHQGGGDAPKEREGPLVARDPVRHLLGAGGLGVGVVRGAEDGDEQLDRDDLARGGVEDGGLLAGVVDEALLAALMDLAHGAGRAFAASGGRARRTGCTGSRRGAARGTRGGAVRG